MEQSLLFLSQLLKLKLTVGFYKFHSGWSHIKFHFSIIYQQTNCEYSNQAVILWYALPVLHQCTFIMQRKINTDLDLAAKISMKCWFVEEFVVYRAIANSLGNKACRPTTGKLNSML